VQCPEGFSSLNPNILECEFGRDLHAVPNRAGDGTKFRVEVMDTLGSLAVFEGAFERVGDVDALDDEHILVLADDAGRLGT